MYHHTDPLAGLPPECVVDALAPMDFTDADFGAFVSDLDSIRDLNEWWLVLTPHGLRVFVESAEVF